MIFKMKAFQLYYVFYHLKPRILLKIICVLVILVLVFKHSIFIKPLPIIVWWTDFPGTEYEIKKCNSASSCIITSKRVSPKVNADAYLFYGSGLNFKDLPLPRKPFEKFWGVYHEESPRNNEILLNENILRLFNFSSTYSRFSDVSFPLQYLVDINDITNRKYYVNTKNKNYQLKDKAPILYIQSDCETPTERDDFTKELMKYIMVDSYGKCLNNKILPSQFQNDYLNSLYDKPFLQFIAGYKFVLAIENAVCEDYITEKLWRPLIVGTVPIYFGSPSIADWLPNPKSAILIDKFSNPRHLAFYIKQLLQNDTLYETYLTHKLFGTISNKKLLKEFKKKSWVANLESVISNFECLVCEKIYDKNHGSDRVYIVDKNHLNCPGPTSTLTNTISVQNKWYYSWRSSINKAEKLYEEITSS